MKANAGAIKNLRNCVNRSEFIEDLEEAMANPTGKCHCHNATGPCSSCHHPQRKDWKVLLSNGYSQAINKEGTGPIQLSVVRVDGVTINVMRMDEIEPQPAPNLNGPVSIYDITETLPFKKMTPVF